MSRTKRNLVSGGGSLDTLAQQASTSKGIYNSEEFELLQGTGSCKDSIRKRPKRKFITQNLSLALKDVAKELGDRKWEQRYWNTYHCQSSLTTHNGRAYGHYCKNRWCSICVSIRKADMINKYKPILDKWSDVHFLTLTVKAQPNGNLNRWIAGMIKAIKQIIRKCNQIHRRGKGPKLIGLRSLECNFNPIKKTYNPHFHILTADAEIARTIKKEWSLLWSSQYAQPYLQKIRKVKNTESDLVETIKYGAKIFTDPTMKKKKGKKKLIILSMLQLFTKSLKQWKDINCLGHLDLSYLRVIKRLITLSILSTSKSGIMSHLSRIG